MQPTDHQPNPGGAAPAARQCHYTCANGLRCRDWALRGHQHCSRHHQYLRALPDRPIDVPLLEDEDSLAYLLSQTLRALAWGAIPPANGRAILAGCRLMHAMLGRRLETAKLRVKIHCHRLDEQQIFAPDPAYSIPDPSDVDEPRGNHNPIPRSADEPRVPHICPPLADVGNHNPVPRSADEPRVPHICPPLADVGNHNPVPRSADATEHQAQEAEPSPHLPPPVIPRFRDLKKNWDKALLHTENQIADMYFRRPGETPEDYRASLATPFQHQPQEEPLLVP